MRARIAPNRADLATTFEDLDTIPTEVAAYLATVPEPARSTLLAVRASIRACIPAGAVECMSYGVPAFRMEKSIAGYCARKDFCSYYPMSGSVLTVLAEDVKGYQTLSGTLRFPSDKPLPPALVQKLVEATLTDIDRKERLRKSKAKKKS